MPLHVKLIQANLKGIKLATLTIFRGDFMFCCVACFNNKYIKEYIKSFEEINDCSFCNCKDTYVITLEVMGHFLRESLEKGYVNATIDDIPFPAQEHLAKSITEVLLDVECIFSEEIDYDVSQRLVEDLFAVSGPSDRDVMQGAIDEWEGGNALVVLRGAFYAQDNNSFSITWEEFKETVKHGNRFFDIHNEFSREEMLNVFTEFFEKMVEILPEGTPIIRARVNSDGPYDDIEKQIMECGPPPPEVARSLRMNPDGISYFYGAEDVHTCIRETRATKDKNLLIGTFKTKQPLKVINLSKVMTVTPPSIFSNNYDHEMNWTQDFLLSFSREISKPVQEDEAAIEYIPTQIISEYIRLKGYDGVKYKSNLTGGNNYTLFCGRINELRNLCFPNITLVSDFTDWVRLVNYEFIHSNE